jgi:hypothetical protein
MSINKSDDAVAEYLHELELRLSGLPVLQRRELLADLDAHIINERIERGAVSEGEVLEILERLGSPEVVAAAAYEEAGLLLPVGVAAGRRLPPIPPPPDEPPFRDAGAPPPFGGSAYAGPPPLFGPPLSPPPFIGHPPAKSPAGSGTRIAVVLAIVTAVFIAFGCLAGSFLLARQAEPESAVPPELVATAPVPAEPADTAPVPPPLPGG